MILKNGIYYPLFVPELGRKVIDLLRQGAFVEMLDHLCKRIPLGSDSAAAFIAFLSTYGLELPPQSVADATDRCLSAANRNDAYAQYVTAWLCKRRGDDINAFNWMMRAATQGLFLPAFIDVGRFMIGGTGVRSPDLSAAMQVFREAHSLGHRAALVYIARLMMKGVSGWAYRPIGLFLLMPAVLRLHWYTRRDPLSETIYITPVSPRLPLFKDQKMSGASASAKDNGDLVS